MATFQTYMELPCVECLRLLETRISKAVAQKERSGGNKRQASLSVSAQYVLTQKDCSHELGQVRSRAHPNRTTQNLTPCLVL
jgi:hypothetical protein